MRISNLLASMATIFSLVHAADYAKKAEVLILAPEAQKDVMKVYAKKDSEALRTTMFRDTDNPGSSSICQGIRDPITQVCPGAEHAGVTMISFDRPTDKPRPVGIIFPDYTIEVSPLSFLHCRWVIS
jgi:hypothetical protein